MNETFTGAAQVDADASPQADGAPSAARIVTGLSRLPGSFSGRYAARIVTGLRLDCPAPPRAATRPASSPGSGAASIGADPAPVNIRNELISGGNTE